MRSKRILFVPFAALAVLLVLGATAFACTIFRGTFTLQGNAATSRVTATGTGTGMSQTVTDTIAYATATGGSVKMWAGSDSYGRKLPGGTYFVRYYNGAGYSDHYHWQTDCMVGGPGVTLGTAEVNNRGRFVGQPLQFALPNGVANTAPQESAVCVSDGGAAYGNQAPVTII